MKILITGALGHIGSRFIHSIKPGEFEKVVLLDNLSTQRYSSLFNLSKGVPFKFVEDDVCTADMVHYCDGIDCVIHLAAITNAAGSFDIQDQVEKVNYEGTERVAKACLETGSKIMFFSTTSVYGTQEAVVDENCSIEELKPQSPYASSKLRAEQMLKKFGDEHGLKYFVGRFGTIFGTSLGMRFHTAINKFCWQACLAQPITVWRTALYQKRPYLDLGDAVRAIDFVIKRNMFDKQTYNIVTVNSTVNDIIEIIKKHVSDLKIEFVDSQIMNQLSYNVSNSKFKSRDFLFNGNLDIGISDTISLIKNMRV
ncbi:MAG: SDR family oxidoreductase [Pseudomonadota bacterium]